MPSIVFNVPRHLETNKVMTWAPGTLFVKHVPRRLVKGEYVYVCHRNCILFRAKYKKATWGPKISNEGEDRGNGWRLEIGKLELPPQKISRRCHIGFSYVAGGELW